MRLEHTYILQHTPCRIRKWCINTDKSRNMRWSHLTAEICNVVWHFVYFEIYQHKLAAKKGPCSCFGPKKLHLDTEIQFREAHHVRK